MNKSVKYLLGGVLAVLGFSSCSALREAREAREEREREAFRQQQMELKDQLLNEMLERDANDPEFLDRQRALEKIRTDSVRRAEMERTRLLYAVPNVPYRELEKK